MSCFPLSLKKPLLLASTSKYRRKIMDQLGLEYECAAPDYEEDHNISNNPDELVLVLAEGKARSLAAKFPGHYIIGCDQMGEFAGRKLCKPGNFAAAREQLLAMNGRSHRLLTGLVVLDSDSGRVVRHLEVTTLTMRQLTAEQTAEYLQKDEPFDCAGSYKIESSGLALFSKIEGGDYSAIIGLPALGLIRCVEEMG